MAYSAEILRRARTRLAAQKAESEREQTQHREDAYARYPRLAEIEQALRAIMAQAASAAFRGDGAETIEHCKQESLQLQRERAWILEAAELGEDYLDPVPICPTCGGSGYCGAQMCSCLAALCRDEQRKALSSLLRGNENFDAFRLDLYPDELDTRLGASPRRIMTIVKRKCQAYAASFCPQTSPSLLFSGEPGLGKTFLSACIARAVVSAGFSVTYETAITLFADFEAARFGREGGDPAHYLQCDLLIIDDLGTEMATQLSISTLYQIINSRMLAQLPIIISTNLTMEEMERRYTPQIISRLRGNYICYRFYGRDIRQLER